MKTLLVYSPRYREHDVGWGHPERPERLDAIVGGLRDAGLWDTPRTPVRDPKKAQEREVRLVHPPEYLELVKRLCASETPIDGDTPTRKQTYELALLSAGGAVEAALAVCRGEAKNSFALVRPPGHHALRSMGGGFCYFNNVAIAVRIAQAKGPIRRVLIFDFDAHHGNGTQDIFLDDSSVLYISFHQWPLYPGTGRTDEIGVGEGEGFTVNLPMPPGSGDPEYRAAVDEVLIPLIEQFRPDLVAVSAGFDAHRRDPLTSLALSSEAYGWMMSAVLEAAERSCRGRTVVVLEGGYDLVALRESVLRVVRALQGERFEPPAEGRQPPALRKLKKVLRDYWNI
jgi:acetoin utilization deacetylase AcuC-like enzyme